MSLEIAPDEHESVALAGVPSDAPEKNLRESVSTPDVSQTVALDSLSSEATPVTEPIPGPGMGSVFRSASLESPSDLGSAYPISDLTTMPPCYKAFVGGLSSDTTSMSLQKHFEDAYGPANVESAMVMEYRDKLTGWSRSRGFGFIIFTSQEALDFVLSGERHLTVDGKGVEVKRIEDGRYSHIYVISL